MISCIIVDDEHHAIDLLAGYVAKLPLLDLRFATTKPIDAFDYINKNKTDLVFLDIHMPELDGIQFLKLLKGRSKVILTTAYSQYALEGYEHDIMDYLLKPIVFERFLKAVQKVIDLQILLAVKSTAASEPNAGFIFVKTGARGKLMRVSTSEIEYITALGNYVTIHTTAGKIVTLLTLKELQDKLSAQRFIRIHNSYLISTDKIVEIEGNQVRVGKGKLPIGEVYKKGFITLVEKHMMKSRKS